MIAAQKPAFWLICPHCRTRYEPGAHWFGCATCKDPAGFPYWLEVEYDLERVAPDLLRRAGRVWDYAPVLPVRDATAPPTLGEGNTPLVRLDVLNREIGLPNLYFKLETVNPTGAFKDRFHTVAMAVARELGFQRAMLTTAGNHGVACAAYAARVGISLLIITDPQSSPEQRRLMRLFGAHVTSPRRPGPVMPNARALMDTLTRQHGFYPSTVLGTFTGPANPYGIEGYTTIAYEVAAQLGCIPDRVCTPTSGGDLIYGLYKGFRMLQALGLADRLPCLTACQSAGANFVAESVRQGDASLRTITPTTFAISIGDPTGGHCILEAIRQTDGDAWDAPDAELLTAMQRLGRHGICTEGASATTLATLLRQVAAGTIDREELIVAVLTGTGMKWPAQIDAALGPPAPLLPDDVDTILTAMG